MTDAQAVLLSECGPEVLKGLEQHHSALVSIGDLAAGSPALRAFLRSLADLYRRHLAAESSAQHWRTRCTSAEERLRQVSAELEALRSRAAQEQRLAEGLQVSLAGGLRTHEEASVRATMARDDLAEEFHLCRSEAVQLSAEARAQSQALNTEYAAVVACNNEIRHLRVDLEARGAMSRQETLTVDVLRRQLADASLGSQQASEDRAYLAAALERQGHDKHAALASVAQASSSEVAHLQQQLEGRGSELHGARRALAGKEATWLELRSILPSGAAAVEFLRDPGVTAAHALQSHSSQAPGGPAPVRIPVLSLRWGPNLALNTTPTWWACRDGIYSVFHQLQTGALAPEQVELTVCVAEGRWFCTREEEGPLFAALLMYQAMRRDAMVAPTCRIRTPFAVLNMTEHELAQCNGLSVCSVRPQWRMPPREHEDFLQAFLHDSPLREDVEHFIHMRRRGRVEAAHAEEARRDPLGSVMPVPGPLRVLPVQRPPPPVPAPMPAKKRDVL